jgi:hypothetical protein
MRATEKDEAWVVFLMTLQGSQVPMNAVCRQSEWEQMERTRPGFHTLIRSGIASESEAEKLARGKSGDPVMRRVVGAKRGTVVGRDGGGTRDTSG